MPKLIMPIVGLLAFLGAGAASALELPAGKLIDLSYPYNSETVYWPTAPGFEKVTDAEGVNDKGYYYSAYSVKTAEHGGTHLDAPVHFAQGRHSADQIPLQQLMGSVVVVDVAAQAAADRDYQVSVADFARWEAEHGRLPDNVLVVLRTGFGQYWPDRQRYMGTAERGAAAVAKLHFPGLHPDAAKWLVNERTIKAIGLDTPSIDFGQSVMFESHRTLFAANIPAFENLANLDQLPVTGAVLIALPMKIEGGSGGPLRAVAIVPQ